MTMRQKQGFIVVLTAILAISLITPQVAATENEEPIDPDEIKCPSATDIPFNETLQTSDYTSCKKTKIVAEQKVIYLNKIDRWRQRTDSLRETGKSLKGSKFPGASSVGDRLVGIADAIDKKLDGFETDIRAYEYS